MIGERGTRALAAFDYVQLATGDLACLTWSVGSGVWAGVVFYAAQEVARARTVLLAAGQFWKLVTGKDAAEVRAYSTGLRGVELITDPVGGMMVHITAKDVARHFSGREYVDSRVDDASLGVVLPLLKVPATSVGVSDSTLLGKHDPDDLDLIVYEPEAGQRVARTIRKVIADDERLWLRGYWGRPHHHRRFRIEGLNVCTKFPLPVTSPAPWLGGQLVGELCSLAAVVIADDWGHCSPARYRVRVTGAATPIDSGAEVEVYSNESAHSMAFSVGDVVHLTASSVYRTAEGWVVTIPMGNVDAMRPAEQ